MENEYSYALATADGKIHGVTSGPYLYVRCDSFVSDSTHYMDIETQQIKSKVAYEYTQEVNGLSVALTGLPVGVSVTANGTQGQTDSEPMVVTFDVPGTYRIELSGLVEYLDDYLEVTVGDA